jgi:hypothetical protein
MSNGNGIDPKFFNQVSQWAHSGVACSVFFILLHFFSMRHVLEIFLPIGVALAAWKEFWYDKHDENAATRGSDLEDFTFYMVGIAAALSVSIL